MPNADKQKLLNSQCFFTNRVSVNGMIFKSGQWLPDTIDSGNKKLTDVFEICDIVMLSNEIEDIYAVCKSYTVATAMQECNVYSISFSSVKDNFFLIKIKDYLVKHHYPVNVHRLGQETCFRCKRF